MIVGFVSVSFRSSVNFGFPHNTLASGYVIGLSQNTASRASELNVRQAFVSSLG